MHKLLLESERTGITTATPPTAAYLLRARQPQTLLAFPKQSYHECLVLAGHLAQCAQTTNA